MWQLPWKYKESFLVALALLACGILLNITVPAPVPRVSFPYNLVAGIDLVIIPLLLIIYARQNHVVRWLCSIPASLSAIVLFSVLSLLAGFIPQDEYPGTRGLDAGFTHLVTSWQYFFSEVYLLATLSMVTMKRAIPFRWRNAGFLLNHLGLWLVLAGIALGAGDKEKLMMRLQEGETVCQGYNENQQIVKVPVAIKLRDFHIEDYKPSVAILNNKMRTVSGSKAHDAQFLVDSGASVVMLDWTIRIARYYPNATCMGSTFVPSKAEGSAPAAYVEATSSKGVKARGWISCGNYASPRVFLQLDSTSSMAMTVPQPKRYSSRLTVHTGDQEEMDTLIEVNRPLSAGGWMIYQTGFDERKGKWSEVSIVQLVRDPWLPVVYTGFYMLILGAGFIFWKGRGNKQEHQ